MYVVCVVYVGDTCMICVCVVCAACGVCDLCGVRMWCVICVYVWGVYVGGVSF